MPASAPATNASPAPTGSTTSTLKPAVLDKLLSVERDRAGVSGGHYRQASNAAHEAAGVLGRSHVAAPDRLGLVVADLEQCCVLAHPVADRAGLAGSPQRVAVVDVHADWNARLLGGGHDA